MSIWDLRQWIEARIPWWVLPMPLLIVIIWNVYVECLRFFKSEKAARSTSGEAMSKEDFDKATLAEARKRANEFEFGGDIVIDKYHRAVAYACFLEGVKWERAQHSDK